MNSRWKNAGIALAIGLIVISLIEIGESLRGSLLGELIWPMIALGLTYFAYFKMNKSGVYGAVGFSFVTGALMLGFYGLLLNPEMFACGRIWVAGGAYEQIMCDQTGVIIYKGVLFMLAAIIEGVLVNFASGRRMAQPE
jgi:hypothetical protein